jgi:arylsulfatase A-like enzyme
LGQRGYATAFFGKWHLGRRDRTVPMVGEAHAKIIVPPEARGGFEFWEGFESGFLLNNPWLHGTRLAKPERFEGYQSDVLGARAADWIGGQSPNPKGQTPKKIQPWFCVVSLESPHPPYDAPAAGLEAREPSAIELPANVPRGGEIEKQARRELAGYYAHIEATDRAIGQLLARAPRENTLVVFTSVHGDMHGAHGLFRKGWPYEESVRVPLLVRGPRSTEAGGQRPEARGQKSEARGERREDAVSLVDLPAMMLAGVENSESQTSGFKFQIKNSFARISMPSIVHFPQQCDREWRGMRTKTRKLVLTFPSVDSLHSTDSGQAAGTPWLFFDLEKDPHEQCNLASDAARAKEMAELQALV